MIIRRSTLQETTLAGDVLASSPSRNGSTFDPVERDHVELFRKWREACPNFKKPWHSSLCERCDGSYFMFIAGAEIAKDSGWLERRPFESLDLSNYSYPAADNSENVGRLKLAQEIFEATIEESGRQGVSLRQEKNSMSDYVRELLRMANGGVVSGREKLNVPDEIMDAFSGDIAQEALIKERVLEEMRAAKNSDDAGRFVSLDMMMEMEKDDVDKFLSQARSRIIKRSKSTRKACCSRIGGALDMILGPAGGEYADGVDVDDRGKEDPIGEDLVAFIAEEFTLDEHDNDCVLREALTSELSEQEKFIQKAIKKPGALRRYFDLGYGDQIPAEKAQAKYDELQKKSAGSKKLSAEESKLFKRLQLFLKVLKPASKNVEESVVYDQNGTDSAEARVGVSNTANALFKFMEASHTGAVGNLNPPCYSDAKKTRDDNKSFPTELRRVKSGAGYKAGDPEAVKGKKKEARYDKGADPIGESEDASRTAKAVFAFMEAAKHTGAAGDMNPTPYHGTKKTRDDNKEDFVKTGESPMKGRRSQGDWDPCNKGESKPKYEKGADPIGGATSKQLGRP